jgi:TolB-like protein/class 3 adenylate cyclase/Tfp pilus assembly protein PilF
MSAEIKKEIQLEIAHVLFTDIVGYSKLPINKQRALVEGLNEIVRGTDEFQTTEAAGRLIKIPTGDGVTLVFYQSPEAPVECALEISRALKKHPELQLRMGIHSGPVSGVIDVTGKANVAGAGINMAQRVMDCGDAGHILLSQHVAEDLEQYPHWQPHLHKLGECEVKHGVRVSVVNLYTEEFGNPAVPEKLKAARLAAAARRRRAAFRWLSLGALALLAVVGATGFLFFRYKGLPAVVELAIPAKSVAVLPLENLTEEKENAYFADGIQDELLSNLAKIKDLKVISRTSVMQYKSGITRNLKEIAQQLGVSNVVEGSVRRAGNHVRVSVQLIDALGDRHIWVQNYDRTLADSLALQGELATEIATSVGAALSPEERARVEATPTKNTAAYDAYLRGRALAADAQLDRSKLEAAIRSFQEAVKLDPTFVLAWAYLSCQQSDVYWIGFDPSPGRLAAAKEALDRALALDPNLPETRLALGYYRYYGQRDFTGAVAEFQQAELGLPNNVDVIRAIGLIQRRLGHWDEAIAEMRRAVELDPRNIEFSINLAVTYGTLRRFPEALAIADRILAFEPTNRRALWRKADAFWATGDLNSAEPLVANPGVDPFVRGIQALFQRGYAAAVDILSKALADAPEWEKPDILFNLALAQERAGDVAAARATYQRAAQELQRRLEKVSPGTFQEAELDARLGIAYAGLGEAASAVSEGQKAMALQPTSKDPFEGPGIEEAMARIYALLGDADHAIPLLERLLQLPYPITPALLRLDPVWDQIRNDPRFQKLSGSAPK